MKRPSLTKIQHQDETINRIQQGLLAALQFLYDIPLAQTPVMRTGVALLTTDTAVQHGLGRQVQGWIVTRNNANAVVFEATASADPANSLLLRASAACTVSLLFF